jgi:hypothetical protein
VSVDALTKQTIDAYLQALSAHMKAVQARKARIDGKATAIAVADEPSQSEKRVVSSGTHRKNDSRSSKSPEMPSKREISNTNPKSLDYAPSTPTSRSLYEQRPSMPNEPSTLLTANGNTAGKFLPSTANAQCYALRHTTSHTEVMKKSSLALGGTNPHTLADQSIVRRPTAMSLQVGTMARLQTITATALSSSHGRSNSISATRASNPQAHQNLSSSAKPSHDST